MLSLVYQPRLFYARSTVRPNGKSLLHGIYIKFRAIQSGTG